MRQGCSIRAIGCAAHAALQRSNGIITAVAHFGRGSYGQAAGELVWIGSSSAMHPRTIVIEGRWDFLSMKRLQANILQPWRPSPPRFDSNAAARVRDGCAVLRGAIRRVGNPRSFAAMLLGGRPAFPLDRAASNVLLLAQALRADSASGVYESALPLLGLGFGLTPSGDDLVGAALFARLAAPGSRSSKAEWRHTAAKLADAAQARSSSISATLFADLVAGRTFSSLHRLAETLADNEDQEAAIEAARSLVEIGNSSGWDMLAGFIAGATGSLTSCEELQ
jgi:hypothetical protein